MTSALIFIVVMVAIALVGWGIAELKGKHDVYKANAVEQEAEAKSEADIKDEMNIKDVIHTISAKGYDAV